MNVQLRLNTAIQGKTAYQFKNVAELNSFVQKNGVQKMDISELIGAKIEDLTFGTFTGKVNLGAQVVASAASKADQPKVPNEQ